MDLVGRLGVVAYRGQPPLYDVGGEEQITAATWRLRWRHWRLALFYLGFDGIIRTIVSSIRLLSFGQQLNEGASLLYAIYEAIFVSLAAWLLYKRRVSSKWRIWLLSLYGLLSACLIAVVSFSLYSSHIRYEERIADAQAQEASDNAQVAVDDYGAKRSVAAQKLVLDIALAVFRLVAQMIVGALLYRWLKVADKMLEPFGTAVEMETMPQAYLAPVPNGGLPPVICPAMTRPMTRTGAPHALHPESTRPSTQKTDHRPRVTSNPFRH